MNFMFKKIQFYRKKKIPDKTLLLNNDLAQQRNTKKIFKIDNI